MHRMIFGVGLIAALSFAVPSAALTIHVQFDCAAAKDKVVGTYVKCRSKADAAFIGKKGVDSERRNQALAKCLGKFQTKWQEFESRYPSYCSGPLDLPDIAALLDDCSLSTTVGILGTGGAMTVGGVMPKTVITLPPETLLKCGQKRTKAAGSYFKCRMTAEAKFIKSDKGFEERAAALTARLGKCSDAFAKKWAKAGHDSECPPGQDLPDLVQYLTSCSADSVGGTTPRVDECYVDNGTTVADVCTKLEWERKSALDDSASSLDLHDADNPYGFAGRCAGPNANVNDNAHCQPNAAAASTCALQSGALTGCDTCEPVNGPCTVTFGITTIWDWLNDLNASTGAEPAWRVPSVSELLTLKKQAEGECGGSTGACISPIVGPTALSSYWTNSESFPCCAFEVPFFDSGVTGGRNKTTPLRIRAVRSRY